MSKKSPTSAKTGQGTAGQAYGVGQIEGGKITDMWKVLLYLVLSTCFLFVGYFFGSFSTSFSLNTEYSKVISMLAAETKRTLHSRNPNSEHFEKFLDSLPLRGYETNPDELSSSILQFKKKNEAMQK